MADKEKTYKVSLDGQSVEDAGAGIATSAADAARGLDILDAKAKAIRSTLAKLTGSSEEVKEAKKELKGQLDETRAASNYFALALIKEKSSYAAASAAATTHKKKLVDLAEAEKKALQSVGDARKKILDKSDDRKTSNRDKLKSGGGLGGSLLSVKDAAKRFSELRSATGSTGGALSKMAGEAHLGTKALNLVGRAGVAGVAAFAALTVAVVAGVVAFGVWTLKAADAAAQANRFREALWGNEKDAKALGTQITDLAGRVPQGTDELNKLALSLSKTKLSGTATVNTLNAVAQAAGAVDAEAGSKIQEIITRNQHTGRMHLGRRELQGTGLDFSDVAQAYAKVSKKSVEQAKKDLLSGRASMEKGAEAFRVATEKKFGKLNVKNAFSLQNAPKKFFDLISSYAAGVDMGPVTDAFQDLYEQLKPGSPLGGAVKFLIEEMGAGMVWLAKEGIPIAVDGLTWLAVGAVKATIEFYKMKHAVKAAFATDGWRGAGKEIMIGLAKGLWDYFTFPITAINSMTKKMIEAFTKKTEIKSPSRLFYRFGKYLPQGTEKGVIADTPKAVKAVSKMASGIEAAAIGPRLGGSRPSDGSVSGAVASLVSDSMPMGGPGATTPRGGALGGSGETHLHFSNMTHGEASKIAGDSALISQFVRIARDAGKSGGRPTT